MSATLNLYKRFFIAEAVIGLSHDFLEAADLSTYTKTQIAAGDASIQVSANGILRCTGAATTDNSGVQLQLASAPIKLRKGSVVCFGIRQSLSSTLVEWHAGLSVIDASLIASAPSDGVYLYSPENSTEVRLIVRHGSISYTHSLGNIDAADGMHRWGFEIRCDNVDGKIASILVYRDGDLKHIADGISSDIFLDMPNDVNLTPSFAMQSGSAVGTQYVDVDYMKFTATRY